MTHSLMAPSLSPSPVSARNPKMMTQCSCHQDHVEAHRDKAVASFHHRRALIYSLVGIGVGFSLTPNSATAAQRRLPPSPPEEKKDPNVSGVQAKVLASKKRKEAMKEEIEKLRQKGKPVS